MGVNTSKTMITMMLVILFSNVIFSGSIRERGNSLYQYMAVGIADSNYETETYLVDAEQGKVGKYAKGILSYYEGEFVRTQNITITTIRKRDGETIKPYTWIEKTLVDSDIDLAIQ